VVGIRRISDELSVGILDLRAFTGTSPCEGKRDAEKKGAQFLLASMLNDPAVSISYTEANRPFLEGRKEHISISHSHDRLAIALNKSQSTGIDIELLRDKVLHIAHKFVNEEESAFTEGNIEKLITVWAAKEALYKAGGEREVDFRKHMKVSPAGDGLLHGEIRLKKSTRRYLLFYKRVEDYMLVFTLHEV
jgi:4'-phosphopantetheinyl transferase